MKCVQKFFNDLKPGDRYHFSSSVEGCSGYELAHLFVAWSIERSHIAAYSQAKPKSFEVTTFTNTNPPIHVIEGEGQ